MSISKKLNNILKTEQIEQRTAEWYKIRCQMITASQCASILDCDGYTSSEKLLDKKCNVRTNIKYKSNNWNNI